MTPADTASAFARECLRWEDALTFNGAALVFEGHGRGRFNPADLAAVLTAVRAWCDTNDGAVELAYYGYVPGEWEARVSTSDSLESLVHADPCQALMTACLAAQRGLIA